MSMSISIKSNKYYTFIGIINQFLIDKYIDM